MNTSKKLPPLPRTIKKREAQFGTLFRHWMEAHPIHASGAYELKQSVGYTIPFGVLSDNQIAHLLAAKSDKGVLVRVEGLRGEPDYVYLRNASAWVVIKFRGSFHVIDIEVFLKEKETCGRRSLTAGRAKQISTYDHNL